MSLSPRVSLILLAVATMSVIGCGPKKDEPVEADTAKVGITVLEEGKGEQAIADGDMAFMLYRGTLTDGTQFDTNMDDPTKQKPFAFVVGGREVIPGWDQGVQGMKVGEKRRLEVPWILGYGEAGNGTSIPPKADLNFEIELVYILKKGEDPYIDEVESTPGTGPEAKDGDEVAIHYKGMYLNGMVWDDTRLRPKGPETAKFTVGNLDSVAPAVSYAVKGMKAGGKKTVIFPFTLAFGTIGNSTMEGRQIYKMEIELVSVNGKS
ncbi:MAG: FKBP-type peptidyl-prolyl cis-trans isomerase [Armatimonadetes bacterium]|nr:FKBP-type peptidyl-prolyl cis-trans isomerase [Armatimonadota bacterium]